MTHTKENYINSVEISLNIKLHCSTAHMQYIHRPQMLTHYFKFYMCIAQKLGFLHTSLLYSNQFNVAHCWAIHIFSLLFLAQWISFWFIAVLSTSILCGAKMLCLFGRCLPGDELSAVPPFLCEAQVISFHLRFTGFRCFGYNFFYHLPFFHKNRCSHVMWGSLSLLRTRTVDETMCLCACGCLLLSFCL